jgi:peroxiredoxin
MEEQTLLNYNDAAPDVEVINTYGEKVRLSSFWQVKPLLLVFTRHFGCPQCKEMLAQLMENRERIEQSGLNIAAVMQGTPHQVLEYGRRHAPGIICLSDPQREAYHAYGLGRGTPWQVLLSPDVIRGTLHARGNGRTIEMPPPGQDAMQMSGSFVIGTDGRIRLPYYYEHIADHPPIDLFLSGVLSTGWDRPFGGEMG